MSGAILEARNLSMRFRSRAVFDALHFECSAGCIVAVIGANGSGKSTVLDILSGWLRPTAGTILLRGRPCAPGDPQRFARSGVGRSFQESRLAWQSSVEENLLLAQIACDMPRRLLAARDPADPAGIERARSFLIQLFGASFLQRRAGELSGGQARVVALAMLISRDAPVLILDEPLAGLSAETRSAVADELRSLKGRGRLVILSEHDLQFVHEVADRVLLLKDGILAETSGAVV